MTQIGLPLEWRGGDDFLVSAANQLAVAHLERWRDWPLSVSILTGPPRSGRSRLASHFARISGGDVIDDAQGQDDGILFHAWNDVQTARRPLLLVGRDAPSQWGVTLPDLRSRLAAAPHVAIAQPDEHLAHALVTSYFAQAGARFAADLPDWLLRRIDRSYDSIARATRLLDNAALASGRKISVTMAKEVLQSSGLLPIVPPDPTNHERE